MKKKFSKILGISVTLALLTSLLLTAVPVSALTQPAVTVDNDGISQVGVEYGIITTLASNLPEGGKVKIEFPTGTDLTAVVAADITLAGTSGIGSGSFSGIAAATIVKSPSATAGPTLTITIPNIPTLDSADGGPTAEFIGVGAMVQILVDDVGNPDDPDTYTLDVSTLTSADAVIEAAVTSGPYELVVPALGALPGIVSVYNAGGYLMGQQTGNTAIANAIAAAGADFTIKIGPGTYTENPNTATTGVTFEATGELADTVIKGDWAIDLADITLEGLTVMGEMTITGDDALLTGCSFAKLDDAVSETLVEYNYSGTGTIENCIFDTTAGAVDDIGLYIDNDGLTVSDCSFMVDEEDWGVELYYDATVEDCDFTGSSGIGIYIEDKIAIITGNTFDGLMTAIWTYEPEDGTVISGNTIMNCTGHAIWVEETDGYDILIINNTITDTDEDFYALSVDDDAEYVHFLFNNVTGNALNVENTDTATLDVSNNWWGSADGPASASVAGDVTTDPPLGVAVTDAAGVIGASSLDASGTVGVKVEGASMADIIGVASYDGNPQETLGSSIAFFDVLVMGATADPTVKIYEGNADTALHAWSTQTDIWVEQAASWSEWGGYVYAEIDRDLLSGTAIALVDAPVAATLPATVLASPAVGAEDVVLSPTFAWGAVAGADAYYLELADNAAFVLPMVKLGGDLGQWPATAYVYAADLDYLSVYYWRIKAVSGSVGGGDLVESAWVSGVFTTVDEPAAEVWMSDDGLTFDTRAELEAYLADRAAAEQPADIIIEPPDVIVPLPAETPITPAWIYAIIGVGALLVIAVIVLIVRTRRVA